MSASGASAARRRRRFTGGGLLLVLAAYGVVTLPIVERQGIHWDEHHDLMVAAAYLEEPRGWVAGSRIDVINVRLPSFSVAVLSRLGLDLELRSARLVSCAVGALAIAAIALFGHLALDERRGLLAAALVATSPYFVAFSHLAFTEGDVFVACAVSWVLLTGEGFRQSARWMRGCALGLALGLALSAKISALAVVPAVILAVLLPSAWQAPRGARRERLREAAPWIGCGLVFGIWLLLQAVGTGAALGEWRGSVPDALDGPRRRLALVGALWGALIAWAVWSRSRRMPAVARLLYPLLVAATTFFVVPPVHTTNPAIFAGLVREFLKAGGGFDPGFALEAAALHFAVVLLKPGVIVGALLWLGTARAAVLVPRRPELRLPMAIFAFYAAFLLTLPWAQTRYMMPLFPLMAVLGADAFVALAERHRRTAVAAGLAALGLLVWDYRLCYPDLNLNGYQWVGARYWAGRSTLGYRSIAQVGSDGVEQVVRWIAGHAPPGSRVAVYVPRHIAHAHLAEAPVEIIDGIEDPTALERADYVLSALNAEIRSGNESDDPMGDVFQYPRYDRALLERDFRKVYSVRRAFDIEVASVWQRR